MKKPEASEALEFDLDLRLTDVWAEIEVDPMRQQKRRDFTTQLGALLRHAYALGYRDALHEQVRGQLYRDHGYDG